ncbi:unnamed protein product [Danaus chrysippus]|uniref:(African queen) hypothetical protein n=1 Tax=Danaus chrysippus TaxID=151541 RepID=A0A8J2W769_9NEOP|nr:unnamed protein product [Danaus chrysippus]
MLFLPRILNTTTVFTDASRSDTNESKSAHVKDGVAVVRFLRWVHELVDSGANVTERNVVDKLDEIRRDGERGRLGYLHIVTALLSELQLFDSVIDFIL